MNPVIQFEGIETNYINPDRLERTVRLVPSSTSDQQASYGELLNGLCAAGIQPDEINGIFKVSSNDNSYSVLFGYHDTVERVVDLGEIYAGKCKYLIMKMSEQVVSIRVHWLPIYFDNAILHEILSDYGKVLDISLMKTSHEKLVALNGTREVRLKTDEFRRHQIPHMVQFKSGQNILLTMAGRPPYCLRCRSVGHVRQRCPGSRSYAAAVVRQVQQSSDGQEVSQVSADPPPGPAREVPAAPPAESLDTAGGEDPTGGEAGTSGGKGSGEEQLNMDESTDQSLKRDRDVDESQDSFISPNRTAKGRPPSRRALSLKNAFSPITDVADFGDFIS